MSDTEQKYFSMVTEQGLQVMAQAIAEGVQVNISQIAVGDGDGTYYKPDSTMTSLRNEVWRGDVSECRVSENSENVIIISGMIPADVGGFTVREIAVFDEDGVMIAIGNTQDAAKVTVTDGIANDMYIGMEIAIFNKDVIALQIDPSAIIVTRQELINAQEVILDALNTQIKEQNALIEELKQKIQELDERWAGCYIDFKDEKGESTDEPYIQWDTIVPDEDTLETKEQIAIDVPDREVDEKMAIEEGGD